jgi:hypothetical protein
MSEILVRNYLLSFLRINSVISSIYEYRLKGLQIARGAWSFLLFDRGLRK